MKVEIESQKLVKPCTPTPSHLRRYKISMIDELNPPMHVIRILYYPPTSNPINLEPPLAQVLPLFYPLAGRYIKLDHTVDCNDAGAHFSQARVDCRLHALMDPAFPPSHLNSLLPVDIAAADEPTDPMLAIQINRFQCGGVAIGVCASHRIFDACSLSIFLTAWANAAVGGDLVITPDFNSPSLFPSANVAPLDFGVSRTIEGRRIVGKRIVFDKNEISRLREKVPVMTTTGRPPSRVVVVSTVLTQALLRADRVRHGRQRSTLIAHAINVRERTVPPVHKHACGTWVSISYTEYDGEDSRKLEGDYVTMVGEMREATVRGVVDCGRIFSEEEFGRWVLVDSYAEIAKKGGRDDYKVIYVTDWSKFGDYDLEMGFGKPVWVSLGDVPLEDLFILMNTRDNDGIEAWVYLDESDMPFFEQDHHILQLSAATYI
uniref:Acyltransferase ACT4 n=1 Tax=Plectranthus barbatus TaxID=41228 RepID=A0A1B0VRQ4_9LAMI|nr:acyltransferase ACT4 [Plectranthus barbatus]